MNPSEFLVQFGRKKDWTENTVELGPVGPSIFAFSMNLSKPKLILTFGLQEE